MPLPASSDTPSCVASSCEEASSADMCSSSLSSHNIDSKMSLNAGRGFVSGFLHVMNIHTS